MTEDSSAEVTTPSPESESYRLASGAQSAEARRAEDAEVAVNRRITAWQIQHGIYTGIQHIPPRPGELSLGEAIRYLEEKREVH